MRLAGIIGARGSVDSWTVLRSIRSCSGTAWARRLEHGVQSTHPFQRSGSMARTFLEISGRRASISVAHA